MAYGLTLALELKSVSHGCYSWHTTVQINTGTRVNTRKPWILFMAFEVTGTSRVNIGPLNHGNFK